jgi:ergothioneine biosynthesis protein EgtB
VDQTYAYRTHIDQCVSNLLQNMDEKTYRVLEPVITLGLHHEQQHQELILTDIKHALSENPLHPIYKRREHTAKGVTEPLRWVKFEEGLYHIGYEGDEFAFDNEGPRHREFLNAFSLASRLVINEEYQQFMADGGYARPELWLSAGWSWVQENHIQAPLYWQRADNSWQQFTLRWFTRGGSERASVPRSLFEADAYARWSGARLPTEAEWESRGGRRCNKRQLRRCERQRSSVHS